MALEDLSNLLQWLTVALLCATAAVGFWSHLVNKRLNRQLSERLSGADERIAGANRVAAEANEKTAASAVQIAELNRQAEELKLKAEEARLGISNAQADAGRGNERAGALEVEAATMRERAAVAEFNLRNLAERQKPRHLTPEQRQRLAWSATNLVGITVDIMCGDPEACAFGAEIIAALRSAGVTVTGDDTTSALKPFRGIRVVQKSQGAVLPPAMSLLTALREFSPEAHNWPDLPDRMIEIRIGAKP